MPKDDEKLDEIIVMMCDDFVLQQVSEDLHFFITEDVPTIPGIRTISPDTPDGIPILFPEAHTDEEGYLSIEPEQIDSFSLLPEETSFFEKAAYSMPYERIKDDTLKDLIEHPELKIEDKFDEITPHKPHTTGDLLIKTVLHEEEKEFSYLPSAEICSIKDCNKRLADPDFSLFCVEHFNQARAENWKDFFPPRESKVQRPRPISKVNARPSQPPENISRLPTLVVKKGKDRR